MKERQPQPHNPLGVSVWRRPERLPLACWQGRRWASPDVRTAPGSGAAILRRWQRLAVAHCLASGLELAGSGPWRRRRSSWAKPLVGMLTRSVDEADNSATAQPQPRADVPRGLTGRPALGQLVAQPIEILLLAAPPKIRASGVGGLQGPPTPRQMARRIFDWLICCPKLLAGHPGRTSRSEPLWRGRAPQRSVHVAPQLIPSAPGTGLRPAGTAN